MALRAHRLRGAAQVRGRQPDRLVQGPRHDHGHLDGRPGGRAGCHLRLDRQHLGVGRGLCRARPAWPGRCSFPRARSPWASSPRPWSTARSCCRSTATSTTASGWPASCRDSYPVALVNSVNPARIEGQKTAAFEIVDPLGDAPDIHCCPSATPATSPPTGRATASTPATAWPRTPRGCGASRPRARRRSCAAPPCANPETIATAIRIGNPASWEFAVAARDESGGLIDMVSDDQILEAHLALAARGRPVLRAGLGGLGGGPARGAGAPVGWTRARRSCARSPGTASRTPSGRWPGPRTRQ